MKHNFGQGTWFMVSSISSGNEETGSQRPIVHGSAGGMITRLADTKAEIKAAQKLRYKVFCSEMSAKTGMLDRLTRRERDTHDKNCDHLLVIDEALKSNCGIVGTQRFTVADASHTDAAFYSKSEFEITDLLDRHADKRFMELGRSCILPEYRNKRTMELMWHGTWDYALQQNADVMFGCASFHTENLAEIRNSLAFLLQTAPAEAGWQVSSQHRNAMDLSGFETDKIDPKSALRGLPNADQGLLEAGSQVFKRRCSGCRVWHH